MVTAALPLVVSAAIVVHVMTVVLLDVAASVEVVPIEVDVEKL